MYPINLLNSSLQIGGFKLVIASFCLGSGISPLVVMRWLMYVILSVLILHLFSLNFLPLCWALSNKAFKLLSCTIPLNPSRFSCMRLPQLQPIYQKVAWSVLYESGKLIIIADILSRALLQETHNSIVKEVLLFQSEIEQIKALNNIKLTEKKRH